MADEVLFLKADLSRRCDGQAALEEELRDLRTEFEALSCHQAPQRCPVAAGDGSPSAAAQVRAVFGPQPRHSTARREGTLASWTFPSGTPRMTPQVKGLGMQRTLMCSRVDDPQIPRPVLQRPTPQFVPFKLRRCGGWVGGWVGWGLLCTASQVPQQRRSGPFALRLPYICARLVLFIPGGQDTSSTRTRKTLPASRCFPSLWDHRLRSVMWQNARIRSWREKGDFGLGLCEKPRGHQTDFL